MTEKICNACNELKQLSCFSNQKRGLYGKRSRCKPCENASRRERYERNPEAFREKAKAYRQKSPEIFSRKDKRYYEANKEKVRESNKAWKRNNPDKYAELNRRKEHVRRARKSNNGSSPYFEQQILDLYGTFCHLCHSAIDFSAPRKVGEPGWELGLQIDHLIPISAGGPDTLENVRPAHGLCNNRKGNRMVDLYL